MEVNFIEESDFFQKLENNESFIAYITAEWCMPCKRVKPIVETVAKESTVEIVKVDLDSCPEVVMKFGIRSVPTFLFLENTNIKDKLVGAVTQRDLQTFITNNEN